MIAIGPVHQIINEVLHQRRLSRKEFFAGKRTWEYSNARHEIIYRALAETTYSASRIGLIIGITPESIMYGMLAHHVRTGAPILRGYADKPLPNRLAKYKRSLEQGVKRNNRKPNQRLAS